MSGELGISALGYDEIEGHYGESLAPFPPSRKGLHMGICSLATDPYSCARFAKMMTDPPEVSRRTENATIRANILPICSRAGTKGEAQITAEVGWGNPNGPTYSVNGSGSIQDSRGNYISGQVQHDSKGQGSASLSAGVTTDSKKNEPPRQR